MQFFNKIQKHYNMSCHITRQEGMQRDVLEGMGKTNISWAHLQTGKNAMERIGGNGGGQKRQRRPKATWTDNIKVWTWKTKSHMDRQHQGVDIEDREPHGRQHQGADGEDQEPHGQTTSKHGQEDQEPHGQTTSRCGLRRPRTTWTDNIKAWTWKTKSHVDRQHQGMDMEDQEPHGQTTLRCGRGRPRAMCTDNKVWTGKIRYEDLIRTVQSRHKQ